LGRGRNTKSRRPGSVSPQETAPDAKATSWNFRIGLAALALLAIAAFIGGFYSLSPPPRSKAISLGASTSCSTTDIRRLAILRASAEREIAKIPAYTQGLVFEDGELFESTGQEGHSSIYRLDLDGRPRQELARLNEDLFGEGLAKLGQRFYQLTWKAGLAFAYQYDRAEDKFNRVATYHRDGEGWGLAPHGDELVLSDGSSALSFVTPDSFEEIRRLPVRLGKKRVTRLNELEIIADDVLANIYGDSRIVGIDLKSGCVTTVIDAAKLISDVAAELRAVRNPVCDGSCSKWDFVINGIAYDREANELYITGKNWPLIFVYRDLL
jgi:glutaminyl-peptide cyclotransferase